MRRNLVIEVFVTEAALSRFGPILADVPVHVVTDRAAKALSDTVTPVGLVAVCDVPSTSLADVLADQPRLVAVAAEISEPGNAGTLIRIADAMGADAVVLAGNSVDPYNGKCLRASAGSIFAVPVVSEADAGGAVSALRSAGLQVLATTVDGEVSLDDADLSRADRMAVRTRIPWPVRRIGGIGGSSRSDSDVGRGGEPQRGGGRRDLPLPERQSTPRRLELGAECANSYATCRAGVRNRTPVTAQRQQSDNPRCQTAMPWSDDEPTVDGERDQPSLPAHRVSLRPWACDGRGIGRCARLPRLRSRWTAFEVCFGRSALGDDARPGDSTPSGPLPSRRDVAGDSTPDPSTGKGAARRSRGPTGRGRCEPHRLGGPWSVQLVGRLEQPLGHREHQFARRDAVAARQK